MTENDRLDSIITVLQQVSGYFVLREGKQEFIVGDRQEVMGSNSHKEVQLTLSAPPRRLRNAGPESPKAGSEDDLQINHELALAAASMSEEDAYDDLALDTDTSHSIQVPQEGTKVTFEPLKGDLSPDLQD